MTARDARTLAPVAIAVVLAVAASIAVQVLEDVTTRMTIGVVVTAALLAFGVLLRRRPGCEGPANAVLALGAVSVFGWASAIITANEAVAQWISTASLPAVFLLVNSTKLISVAVLLAIAVGYRWSPRRLLVTRGELNAPTGVPGLRWSVAGPLVIVVVSVLFLTDPAVLDGAHGADDLVGVLLGALPLLVAGPFVNAVSEELLYRHALIGTTRSVTGPCVALLLSSVIFGLGHVTGNPGGVTGVLFTFVFGLVTGLAMLQNRGTAWNTTIHFFADLAAITGIVILGAT